MKLCKQPRQFLLYLRRSYFFNKKTCINTDGEKNLWMLFRLQSRRPRRKKGFSCMLYFLCYNSAWMAKSQRAFNAFCPSHDTEGPTDHLTDCYFCIIPPLRHGIKKTRTVNCPNISSAIRPVPHTEDFPFPVPPKQYILDSDDKPTENQEKTLQTSTSTDAVFTADLQFNEFHRITQEDLNDLIRDLDLPKNKAELLG